MKTVRKTVVNSTGNIEVTNRINTPKGSLEVTSSYIGGGSVRLV